jgi:mono/diheme cytochrome c family protein
MRKSAIVFIGVMAGLAAAGGANASPSVERGNYLVNTIMGCGNCHTPQGPEGPMMDKALSGMMVDNSEAFTAIAPNITPAGRVADWSDAELARAIREGIRPDGTLIGPPMPFEVYKGISDTDLASVVMYLRTVAAVENDPGKSEYRIPLPPAYGPPVASVADVTEGVTVEYGAYLAGPLGHCVVCHTPMGPDGQIQLETLLGAGGMEFPGPWGVSVAANITPVGLGGYTDAELKDLIHKGVRPNGQHLLPPMPSAYLAGLTDDDVSALVLYLRSLEPKTAP